MELTYNFNGEEYIFDALQQDYISDLELLFSQFHGIGIVVTSTILALWNLYDAVEDYFEDDLRDILTPRYETEAEEEYRASKMTPDQFHGVSRRD